MLKQFRFKQSCEDTVDRRIALFCGETLRRRPAEHGEAAAKVSLRANGILELAPGFEAICGCAHGPAKLSCRALALRQIAKLLTERNVSGCSAPRVRCWASKTLL